jgi:arylsulfatase A
MLRKHLLFAVAIALPLATQAAPAKGKQPVKKPNIVLMLADDLGYGDVGCYGAKLLKTPNIDKLAAEGVKFTDAHAPAAVCQPTRYGILAGRYHWRAKRTEPALYFAENEILLPQTLKENGYNTAAFGKWHLGWGSGQPNDDAFWNGEITPGPLDTGFDYYFGVPHSHSQPPFVFIENTRIYKGDPNDPLRLNKEQPSHWKHTMNSGGSSGAKAAHEACDMNRLDLILAEHASDFIAKQTRDKPFFVYLPFYAPHVPILPSKEFQGASNAEALGDFVQQLDHAVGMVMEALKKNGFDENTLVVFTSDNGGCHIVESMALGHNSSGGWLGLKTDVWEGGHRVPFIARWPEKIPANSVCDKLLSLTDLFPTFAAASEILLPKNAAPDGLNLLPLLEYPMNTPAIRSEMVYSGRGRGLRSGDWVYMPYSGSGGLFGTFYFEKFGYKNSDHDAKGTLLETAQPEQLYNLKDDPRQSTNVAAKYPEIARQMAARFAEISRQNKSR